MSYAFGKQVIRNFYPLEGTKPLSLPTQTPTIYLFSAMPTLDAAQNGTDAIASHTLSAWGEQAASPYRRAYTFPAIDDPDPDSNTPCRGYWEAINFLTKASGQVQTVIRQFEVERVAALESMPGTTAQDIKDAYPSIGQYLGDDKLDAMIGISLDELKLDLNIKGLRWQRLADLGQLKLAVAYKAICLACISQIREDNDRFAVRYEIFEKKLEALLNSIVLPYDKDGDGEHETKKQASTNSIIGIR